ncbi:hypothetical protein FIBSPDRAFT_1046866 [Athelia psychrophila]|uniref:BTB domain-containing protein n=1 Tax=Athelia psychrophila TaxID=1759441 RepID=A0A166G085_9AGAM|nr:hypothetical protein FIBSPDRAFT_1046866 [Fibularhizoctonia sp. CBS 109695]
MAESESSGISPHPSRSPSVISDTGSTLPSATLSRHYAWDIMTVFKVEGSLFRVDRTLLDRETNTIPRGAGLNEDPIQLEHIRSSDFEILLDFLKLGQNSSTRHDKKPLAAVDWASVIAVCSVLGMQRVLNLAYKTLSDQQNTQLEISRAGAGFDRATCGLYFFIREKGTANYLITSSRSNVEGIRLHLYPQEIENDKSQMFFVDSSGVLCHAPSGLAVDIVDDVPILRRRRPVSGRPNPWSHPLPEFSFVNSQIRVKFLSDPALPGCTDDLYPDDSWATKNFVLAAHPKKGFHLHPISDFSPWIPSAMAGSFQYETGSSHDEKNLVLVQERVEDVGGERTSWEIVPASKS